MSNVDVFDITVTQLEDFSNVAYEDLSVFDCLDKYLVVTTWSWFGQQARSMMVACDPVADKEKALRYADGLYTNDLMANRMGIAHTGNHYEVWHVVDDPEYSVDFIELEPVDWFGEMGDTLGEIDETFGEGYRQCRAAYEYVTAIDQMF